MKTSRKDHEIARLMSAANYYQIQITADTPYFDVRKAWDSEGVITAGTRIEAARFALGRGDDDCWVWDDATSRRTFAISFQAAEVVSMLSRGEFARQILEKERARHFDPKTPDSGPS